MCSSGKLVCAVFVVLLIGFTDAALLDRRKREIVGDDVVSAPSPNPAFPCLADALCARRAHYWKSGPFLLFSHTKSYLYWMNNKALQCHPFARYCKHFMYNIN